MKIRISPIALAERRWELKLKQIDIAKALGVDQSCVSRWEHGIQYPNEPTRKALCEILKLNPNTLEVIE